MENLNDMTVSMPDITGTSSINHNVRVKLGLNCSEYCIMQYIYDMVKKNREFSTLDIYIKTGFTEGEQMAITKTLISKGFIFPTNKNPPEITTKFESAFTDIASEFENKFWTKDNRTAWPGSKKKSLDLYKKARLKYPMEFLVEQRNNYFAYLDAESKYNSFNRAKMAAERWLLPANEYYLTDWKDMKNQIFKKHEEKQKGLKKSVESVPLSEEERRKAYEQDSNE